MPKTACSRPAGNGPWSGAPLTKCAAGTFIACSRPLSASLAPGSVCLRDPKNAIRSALVARHELHRDAVHAVALSGRLRAVLEDMAEMAATAAAVHFDARHEM